MTDSDLYADLGLSRDATADEIKSAYRKLARETHPDVNPNDPAAEERFKRVSAANTVLSDPDKRARYDEFGIEGLAEGFDPEQARAYQRWSQGARQSPHSGSFQSDVDLEDLLAGFFRSAQGGPAGPRPGRDAEGQLEVAFLDAVLGAKVPVHFQGRPALEVKIPAGARDGARIRLAGQGEPGPNGGPPGDLYLTLRVKPHPHFERQGNDLSITLPVTLPELVRGGGVDVPTPGGDVEMKIPKHAKNGQKMRLRGKGVPAAAGAPAGDLFVTLKVVLPEGHEEELEKIVEPLEALYGDVSPREHMLHGKERDS